MAVPPVRILGIDPGTRVAGWGVIACAGSSSRLVEFGVVRTRGPAMAQRLLELRRGFAQVIERVSPDVVAVEQPFVAKNPKTALAIGMARAVALLSGAEAGLEVHEYPPAVVKRALVGNGAASKPQVASMVRVVLGLASAPEPADASDALAVALAHAHRSQAPGR